MFVKIEQDLKTNSESPIWSFSLRFFRLEENVMVLTTIQFSNGFTRFYGVIYKKPVCVETIF